MTQPFNPAGDGLPAGPAPGTTAAGSRTAGGTGTCVPLSIWHGLPAREAPDGLPCGGPGTGAGSRPPGGTAPAVPLRIWPALPAREAPDGLPCGGPVTVAAARRVIDTFSV